MFSYTQERREEVALIRWYEALLAELPAKTDESTVKTVQELLALPMDIRGYGPVKHAAIEQARAEEARLRKLL